MSETKVYECCKCHAVRETEAWEAPVYNGFEKTDETFLFFPANIKCECGSKMYEEGSNPFGDGSSNLKFDHKGGTNVYEQIRNRPRGIG